MERAHAILSSSPTHALHAERRQRWLSPLRTLASLGLLALGAWVVDMRDATPSIATGPMMLTMLVVPIILPLRMPWQALAAFVVAATYLTVADWSHAGPAEEIGTLAAACSGILLSVVAAVSAERRATPADVDAE